MKKDEYLNALKSLLNTLNAIEVKGKTNLDRLLGSVIMTENLINKLDSVINDVDVVDVRMVDDDKDGDTNDENSSRE